MFPSLKAVDGHITRDGFFKNLKKMAVIAGIDPQRVHPHVLRHTFATTMLNNGADINTIKKLLGHANLAATQIYTHTTFEQVLRVYDQAHPRSKHDDGVSAKS